MTMQQPSTTAMAKTTRPEIGSVVARESLFALLDGNPARKAAWIWGAPGTGKSTLAASYVEDRGYRWAWYQVDPDDDDLASFFHYLGRAARRIGVVEGSLPDFDAGAGDDIAAFARRYFRSLFAGASDSTALVIDNLHALSVHSGLHVALEAGLSQVPRHACVIITSRVEPPATWSRMRAGDELVSVGGEALRITSEELAGIAGLRGAAVSPHMLEQMQARAQGWAAALVLMLEHAKIANRFAEPPIDATPPVVFDYLAGEIFDRFEPATRRFLLRIACLPRMTAEVARVVSGEAGAARLLRNLVHNDYFVREFADAGSQVFVMHPLLRQFLRDRAIEELPDAIGDEAMRAAARQLRMAGLCEDAVAVQIECRDWPGLADVAIEQAAILLAQGRRATLAHWLDLLPADLVEHCPELLLADGAVRLQASPRAARHRFEQAALLAHERGDAAQAQRARSAVIEAILLEFDDLAPLDRWSAELAERQQRGGNADVEASMGLMAARLLRDPADPALHAWIARLAQAGNAQDVPGQAMLARVAVALTHGDFSRASALGGAIDPGRLGAADATAVRLGAAMLCLLDGQHAQAAMHARDGIAALPAASPDGPASWLRLVAAAAAMGLEDRDGAQAALDALQAMPLRRGDQAMLHYLQARQAAIAGDVGSALRNARSALLLALEAGLPWVEAVARLTLAQLLATTGDPRSADAQLRTATSLVARLGSVPLRVAAELTAAGVALNADDEPAALAPLARGFALAREHGVHHILGVRASLLSVLAALALRRDIEPEFARLLVHASGLPPPASALRLPQWPWRFRIRSLGDFILQRGDHELTFSAKGPGRPLELLRVMVALGGSNIRVDQLADALWPNVDADYAYKSFTATLHRLRRILEAEDAVLLRDGRASLGKALVWIDAWALDQVIDEFEACVRESRDGPSLDAAMAFIEEVLALYRGPFLADENDQMAYVARREQLRTRLVRNLARVTRVLEQAGLGEVAIDCYARFIDRDELCEAFHRNLMVCQQRIGDIAGAIASYERVRAVFAARLKSLPSPETQALHCSLRAPAQG